MSEVIVSEVAGHLVLQDVKSGKLVHLLRVGEVFGLVVHGELRQVRLECGGYHGLYYVTHEGERGRLALCMHAEWCEPQEPQPAHASDRQADTGVSPSLEEARLAWVGKLVTSRLALAGGCVRGVVQQITTGGQVVFVYWPRCNQVPVRVTFPVERLAEVLHQPGEEAVAA